MITITEAKFLIALRNNRYFCSNYIKEILHSDDLRELTWHNWCRKYCPIDDGMDICPKDSQVVVAAVEKLMLENKEVIVEVLL